MRKGAFLDAKGLSRKEIAEACNVLEGTVSSWRGSELWQAERDRWFATDVAVFDSRMQLVVAEWVEVLELARTRLLELLVAEKEPGVPNVAAQIEALKVVAGHPATKRLLGIPEQASEGRSGGSTTVTMVIKRQQDGQESVEIHDGLIEDAEFEEVEDVEHREESEDGEGHGEEDHSGADTDPA